MKKALWQDSQTRFIDRIVKTHDRELYAERAQSGAIIIYKIGKRLDSVIEYSGAAIAWFKESPEYVFALTNNWTASGEPREWGSEVVLKRLREHDLHANEKLFADIERQEALKEKTKERDFSNNTEAWLSDNHGKFKKAFADINTANFDKSDRRRRRYEQSRKFQS